MQHNYENEVTVTEVNGDVTDETSIEVNEMNEVNNNEEIEMNEVNEVNNEGIEMNDEESNDALEASDEVQQDGNENGIVLDLESKVGELVDDAFTKKRNLFDRALLPADESELMAVPYRTIPEYVVPIYYDENLRENSNHNGMTFNKTDVILGMFGVEEGAAKPGILRPEHIAFSAFVIVAYIENEQGKCFGIIIKFIDKARTEKLVYLSASDIEDNKHFRVLTNAGFYITNNPALRVRLKSLLNDWRLNVDYIVPYVEKLGYSEVHHGIFMEDGLHLANSKKYIWFNSFDENYIPKGTYEAWHKNIAQEVVKYPLTSFSVICAFAAYLLQILDLNSMFFHFGGRGSKGKTMLLQLATSVHANGSDPGGNSFIKTWHSSKAGLEPVMRGFDGGMGALDELHLCDDKAFSDVIYSISNGSSMARSTCTGAAQKQYDWKFLGLSSGEQSGFEKLSKNKTENATLGRAIRFADIPVTGQIFTDFDGNELDIKDAAALAFKLKEECGVNFGYAGRDFVKQLLQLADSKQSLKALIEKDVQEMFDKLTAGIELESPELRLMRHFAMIVVSGNYAVMFDILPMTEHRVFDAVCHVRDLWLGEMKHFHQQKAKKEDYAQMLKTWLFKNMSKFQALNDSKPKDSCKGYYKMLAFGKKNNVYLIRAEAFEDIFGNQKLSDVCAELIKQDILIPVLDEDGTVKRNQQSHRVSSIMGNNGQAASVRLYAIDASLLDNGEDDANDNDESTKPDLSAQQMLDMMAKMEAMMASMAK